MAVLIIVDMQDLYTPGYERIIPPIEKEIFNIKYRAIIRVLSKLGGERNLRITDALTSPDCKTYRIKTIFKDMDDGSDSVYKFLKENYLTRHTIKVCGLFADACVANLANGLVYKYNLKVQIIGAATDEARKEYFSPKIKII